MALRLLSAFPDGDARKSDTLGAEVDLAVSLCLSWHLLLAWLWDIAVEKAEQEPADCVVRRQESVLCASFFQFVWP